MPELRGLFARVDARLAVEGLRRAVRGPRRDAHRALLPGVRHALEVQGLARSLARQGSTVLLTLHDIRAAYRFDRVLVLHQGRLVADGAPHEVLTAALIREVFRVEARFLESLVPELPADGQ